MTDLKRQLNEDRVLRETARSIVTAQIAHLRQGLSGQRIGEKLADKVGDDALVALENAASTAKKNKGILVALAGLAAAAIAWKPLSGLVQSFGKSETQDDKTLLGGESHATKEQSDDA
jgi:hypothetical protein